VTVVETVLVFVIAPFALFGLIVLLTFGPGMSRTPRYRPGRAWPHEPVWYVARPEVAHPAPTAADRVSIPAVAPSRALETSPAMAYAGGARSGPASAIEPAATGSTAPASVIDTPTRTAKGGASGEW
jgi:hypothetical protein